MKQLDPKAVWLFFITFVLRWSILVFFITVWAGTFYLGLTEGEVEQTEFSFEFLQWLWLIVPVFLAVGYVWARLTWHFYRYEIREDGFRKEYGIIWKKYVTIPYGRVQNVDIYRGLIARLLGLSDLHVQTAGASAQYSRYGAIGLSAEGRLPGLAKDGGGALTR